MRSGGSRFTGTSIELALCLETSVRASTSPILMGPTDGASATVGPDARRVRPLLRTLIEPRVRHDGHPKCNEPLDFGPTRVSLNAIALLIHHP